MGIQVRRAYDPPEPSDGYRVLIDGIWPRGIPKAAAQLDTWARDLAVSPALRRWFQHDPAKWEEFRRRYRAELLAPEHRAALDAVAERARRGTVTLLHGAHDREHNNAVVLAEVLGELNTYRIGSGSRSECRTRTDRARFQRRSRRASP